MVFETRAYLFTGIDLDQQHVIDQHRCLRFCTAPRYKTECPVVPLREGQKKVVIQSFPVQLKEDKGINQKSIDFTIKVGEVRKGDY